ncbi:hypothetical protein EA003_26755, partial [Vibrio anguillarum]|nr:hypothetical protein [Vibrio anguillarum]
NKHFQLFIGYVYGLDNITIQNRYTYCNRVKLLFRNIAQDKRLSLSDVKLSSIKISEDAQNCLAQFNKLEIDKTKSDYLNGWQAVSKEGKSIEVHLDTLYVNFGEDFTNKIHHAIKNYALKNKSSTLIVVLG